VAHRHLAGAETVQANLILQIDQACIRLGVEIRRGNADLEFVFQPFREGFGDLHDAQSSSAFVRPFGRNG